MVSSVGRGALHELKAREYLVKQGIKLRIEGYVQKIVMEQPEDSLMALYKMVGEDVALRDRAQNVGDVGDTNELSDVVRDAMKGDLVTASVHGLLVVQKPMQLGGEEIQVPFTRMAADHHSTPVLLETWCRDLADAVRIHLNPQFAAGKAATKAVFSEIDTDGDGILTMLELYDYLSKKNPGLNIAEFEEGFKHLDVNGDGKVSLAEFEHHLGIRDLPQQVVYVVDPLEDEILAEQEALEAEMEAHADVEALFDQIDRDGDGTLTFDEVWKDLQSRNSGMTVEQASILFQTIDTDTDGYVTMAEFKAHMGLPEYAGMGGMEASEEAMANAEAEATFDNIDMDGKGYITLNDLWDDLESKGFDLSRDQVEMVFQELDINGDGKVSLAEFKAHMGLPDDLIAEAAAVTEMHVQAEAVFDSIDKDFSGTLEFGELWKYLNDNGANLTREAAMEKFQSLDINGDGKVSIGEFKQYLQLPDEIAPEDIPGASDEAHVEAEMQFDQIDVDGSGYLEFDEIWADMEQRTGVMISQEQAMAIFQELDINGDGRVSLVEFKIKMGLNPTEEDVQIETEAEFNEIDVDGSGFLDFDEIWADMEQRTGIEISREQAMAIFQELDINGDGRVSLVEFKIKMGLNPTQEDVNKVMSQQAEFDFEILDRDGSGFITLDELWADLEEKAGGRISRELAEGIFQELDMNGDGRVSIVEFKIKMGLKPTQEDVNKVMSQQAEEDFDIIDRDGSGYITLDELWADLEEKAGGRISREQAEMIFSQLDANGDGKVSIVEFKMQMGVHVSAEEIVAELHEEVENEFANIDSDMSGYIEFEELWADIEAKAGVAIPRDVAEAMFKELDVNGDGKVSLVEFKIKAANLMPTAQDIVEEMHAQAEGTFDSLDTDGSGYIDFGELWADLQKRGMPMTEEQVKEIFAGLDKNGDGKVSLVEFKANMGVPLRNYEVIEQMNEDAEVAFAKIDADGSGFLSLEEITADLKSRGFEQIDDEMVQKIFAALDANSDGKVSMSEFKASLGLAGFDISPFEQKEFAITGGPVPVTDAVEMQPEGGEAALEAPRGKVAPADGDAPAAVEAEATPGDEPPPAAEG